MNSEIREKMERWARWRHYRFGGYGKTITGKLMEGMPGTNCPACSGAGKEPVGWRNGKRVYVICRQCGGNGRVDLDDRGVSPRRSICPAGCVHGELNGQTCHRCRGVGTVTSGKITINPAFIRSTYRSPDDPASERIDRLVCELRRRPVLLGYWFVVWTEYCDGRGGTRGAKAARIHLTEGAYRMRLQRALEWLSDAIADSRPIEAIPFPFRPLDKSCDETVQFSPY